MKHLIKQAADAPPMRHVLRTLWQIVWFWGLFLGVFPALIHQLDMYGNLPTFHFPGQTVVAIAGFGLA